ncbi:uncharacterized protein BX663DRAFT_491756 [Cokeromyces recurvatus]|uniref:uncharacterized protein n=1 Tax=Cokeromyces recurvatus TaxID=90255 RepID=UPI002220238F|nr:uncharacterized protein BX663DRAFT_491756 [Cokeromyces recurvatus]KAI7907696.1 hypothetical protein BX663DRAFT_491756 [Cokeromyces recurvatus]
MDNQQPSTGNLKDIQKDHQLGQRSSNSNFSNQNSSLMDRRLSNKKGEEEFITPMPIGAERMAALRDLGATFEEGKRSIAKVATPTETIVPSFVDSDHLEALLRQKKKPSLKDTCKETVV